MKRLSLVILFLFLLPLSACVWKAPRPPSVLVILVEGLGFNAFTCGENVSGEGASGYDMFCQESVRFTHAYTPSILSQAAVASVLTARYPLDHGVWHNGSQFLSAKIETAAEVALKKSYRTSFFSGGPPIWRKSGVNQGFEVFDDNMQLTLKRLYRPVYENFQLFLNWLDNESENQPFLSMVYLPDLQFIDSPTMNDLGEVRESSYKSQKEEVGESLASLIREMQKRKRWDDTHVFLVGLNAIPNSAPGDPDPRYGEIRPTNVYSESARVSLFIKPAQKQRESPFNWKVDANVSLVDVGATLYYLFAEHPQLSPQSEFVPVSLKTLLLKPEAPWPHERMVLTESAWAQWHDFGVTRFALRRGSFLFLWENPVKVINTLIDRFETAPLPGDDPRFPEVYGGFAKHFRAGAIPMWWGLPRELIDKVELGHEIWQEEKGGTDALGSLKKLIRRYPQDEQLQGWRAIWALRENNWEELRAAGESVKNDVWVYVGARNLGQTVPEPANGCFRFLRSKNRVRQPHLRECGNDNLVDLLTWINGGDNAEAQRSREVFLRGYAAERLDRRVAEYHYIAGLTWDVPLSAPGGPSLADLFLALPEYRKFRAETEQRLAVGRVLREDD